MKQSQKQNVQKKKTWKCQSSRASFLSWTNDNQLIESKPIAQSKSNAAYLRPCFSA